MPLVILSQEEKFDRTITFSQFAKELKEASEKGIDYTLENCYIIYDTIRDKKHILKPNSHDIFGFKQTQAFVGDMVIKNLTFSDTNEIIIRDCRFGNSQENWSTSITFKECTLGKIRFIRNDVSYINIKDSKIKYLKYYSHGEIEDDMERINQKGGYYGLKISNSGIEKIDAKSNHNKEKTYVFSGPKFKIEASICQELWVADFAEIYIIRNDLKNVTIGNWSASGDIKKCEISDNIFEQKTPKISKILIDIAEKSILAYNTYTDLSIQSNIESLTVNSNKIYAQSLLSNDSIISLLLEFKNDNKPGRSIRYKRSSVSLSATWEHQKITILKDYIDLWNHNNELIIQNGELYNDSINFDLKLDFLKNYTVGKKIDMSHGGRIDIEGTINHLELKNNQSAYLKMNKINISESFKFSNVIVDSVIRISEIILPDYNRVEFDSTLINKLGFIYDSNISYGRDQNLNLDSNTIITYESKLNQLITTHKQLIQILNKKGNELKTKLIIQLKDIQTNKKALLYYKKQNLENWFNWQGSEFLSWYSDYGVNPFKALRYCFLTMLYFAMFYFIFYNEWDKIDRGFLIKRFNSVMDYFTTEKRIEDFYSSTHDEEMTTFTDFKNTLDKNKVYMPSMLGVLAKPIYQISLLRYKLLNFSYKKAEFMAGRKWVDLEKKERYWIGGLTFILTITYIIYLIFIRAINSIVLSINAFSTLGFGQIPVRGFTKYVAIIEGFVGWFLLSIFLVSILNQMMNV